MIPRIRRIQNLLDHLKANPGWNRTEATEDIKEAVRVGVKLGLVEVSDLGFVRFIKSVEPT